MVVFLRYVDLMTILHVCNMREDGLYRKQDEAPVVE